MTTQGKIPKGVPDASVRRGRLSLRAKLILGLAALVTLAVLLEGGARVTNLLLGTEGRESDGLLFKAHDMADLDAAHDLDPYVWWNMKANLKGHRVVGRCWGLPVDFTISTNAEGFRGPALAPKGERVRILAIGDSTVFGLAVDNEETWPSQLQRILNAEGERYEVINAGVPGYSAFQGLRFLDKRGLALEPALVIAGFGHNDFDHWGTQTDIERAIDDTARLQQDGEKSFSDFFVLAKKAIQGAGHTLEPEEGETKPRLTEEEFRDTLVKMKELCDSKDVPLVFVLWPFQRQAAVTEPEWEYYQPLLMDTCVEMGAPLLNLQPALAQGGEVLFADPVHGNAEGCRIAAAAIAKAVEPLLNEEDK